MDTFFNDLSWWMILFIFVIGVVATFIDSIVGGGGLISLPALLALGIPPQYALGTNKLASATGAVVSTVTFWRAGRVEKSLLKKVMAAAFLSAMAGALAVGLMPKEWLEPVVLVLLLLVAAFVLRRKDWGAESTYRKEKGKGQLLHVLLFASAISFYDGFMGPGTGTFLLFCFLSMGFDFVTAAGNSRVINTMSNLGALTMFLIHGNVLFTYGLVLAAGMAVGGYFGSRTAIAKGNAFVRILFIAITTALLLKVAVSWGMKWMGN